MWSGHWRRSSNHQLWSLLPSYHWIRLPYWNTVYQEYLSRWNNCPAYVSSIFSSLSRATSSNNYSDHLLTFPGDCTDAWLSVKFKGWKFFRISRNEYLGHPDSLIRQSPFPDFVCPLQHIFSSAFSVTFQITTDISFSKMHRPEFFVTSWAWFCQSLRFANAWDPFPSKFLRVHLYQPLLQTPQIGPTALQYS